MTNIPTQSNGVALQICNAITGHVARNVAFCDTSERAKEIARVCNAHDDLVSALSELIGWVPGRAAWHTDAPIEAVERARAALAKAGAA